MSSLKCYTIICNGAVLGGGNLVIAKGKVRKTVTFDPEVYDYLEKRVKEKKKESSGKIYIATIIDELVRNDMKIRKAFGGK